MKLTSIDREPIHEIRYRVVKSAGMLVVEDTLPIYTGTAADFPSSLDALILTSDLQGVEIADSGNTPRLIGEVLIEDLEVMALEQFSSTERIGVVLAGDLFVRQQLDKRGGKGDVRHVWESFRDSFKWVAGVAGNHDRFGERWPADFEEFKSHERIYYLDGETKEIDGLHIGGISGVIGNPDKIFRRTEEDFAGTINKLLKQRPDILVLHEGPDHPDADCPGSAAIRSALEQSPTTTVICGHKYWDGPEPHLLINGSQVLNVNAKVVILHK